MLIFREMEASSIEIEISNHMDSLAALTMELSTDDVETYEEVPADSWFQFAGKVNGNIGMFFGLALYQLTYDRQPFGGWELKITHILQSLQFIGTWS